MAKRTIIFLLFVCLCPFKGQEWKLETLDREDVLEEGIYDH